MAELTARTDIREAVREKYAAAARAAADGVAVSLGCVHEHAGSAIIRARKPGGETSLSAERAACCDTASLATCCEPEAKSSCCGGEAAAPSSCSCS